MTTDEFLLQLEQEEFSEDSDDLITEEDEISFYDEEENDDMQVIESVDLCHDIVNTPEGIIAQELPFAHVDDDEFKNLCPLVVSHEQALDFFSCV